MSTRKLSGSLGLVALCCALLASGLVAASARADDLSSVGAGVATSASAGGSPQPAVAASGSATTEPSGDTSASGARGPTVAASARLENPVPGEPKKKPSPMGPFALGFQVGMAHVGTGDVANPTYVSGAKNLDQNALRAAGLIGTGGCDIVDERCRTVARRGVHLSLPIQIGGTGVGLRLEPFITIAPSATAYGVYTGPTFEFQVANPLYLGFGFGLKAAWVRADDWQYAADLYGRIPAHATVYVADQLAFVAEFAFGAGASGYVSESRKIVLPGGTAVARKQDMQVGLGRTWDFSFGIRFP